MDVGHDGGCVPVVELDGRRFRVPCLAGAREWSSKLAAYLADGAVRAGRAVDTCGACATGFARYCDRHDAARSFAASVLSRRDVSRAGISNGPLARALVSS